MMAVLFGIVWGAANGLERIGMNVIWPDYLDGSMSAASTGSV